LCKWTIWRSEHPLEKFWCNTIQFIFNQVIQKTFMNFLLNQSMKMTWVH
jgi:hypothetical protein